MINENQPVKCPDCSTWWRGLEHRCAPVKVVVTSTTKPNPKWKDKKDTGCPLCGAHGVHGCTGPRKPEHFCHWCGRWSKENHICSDRNFI